jgi:hypothetical protein
MGVGSEFVSSGNTGYAGPRMLPHDALKDPLTLALLAFAGIFLVVGFLRVVEIRVFHFSPWKERSLIAVHLLGVLFFSLALALLAANPQGAEREWMTRAFVSGFFLLFPLHIYLGLLRRVRTRQS